MKIVKLTAENVKRLTAIEITPDGSLIKVGGMNGAGKSSVLDSIAYALGGKELVPAEPIRNGEPEAKIVVDLGDLVVTRRFVREHLPCDCQMNNLRVDKDGTPVHHEECASRTKFGETRSTLKVSNKEGASYPSPQAVLDKLLGRLSFDPLQFARDGEKRQNETLRTLVGLDLSAIETRRKTAFDRRAIFKKQLTEAEAVLRSMAQFPEAKDAVDLSLISQEMLRAEELRKLADEADRSVDKSLEAIVALARQKAIWETKLEEARKLVQELELNLAATSTTLDKASERHESFVATAASSRAVVPDTTEIRTRLEDAQNINQMVAANEKYRGEKLRRDVIAKEVATEDTNVKKAEKDKTDALAAVVYPVPGLGLSEDGVTFNGVPFEQASGAEQIRVSVAIGLALNPSLKVLLIRNGNALDSHSVKAVAEQAAKADAQVWVEWVAETKDGVAVMLEEGARV